MFQSIDKDYKEFVIKRCEAALMESKAYMAKEQSNEIDNDELQAIAEELCYRQGFNDAIAMILGKNNIS